MSGMSEAQPRETGRTVRLSARAGFDGLTVGRAPGHVQANLVLLPREHAGAFGHFCRANPLPCLSSSPTLPARCW